MIFTNSKRVECKARRGGCVHTVEANPQSKQRSFAVSQLVHWSFTMTSSLSVYLLSLKISTKETFQLRAFTEAISNWIIWMHVQLAPLTCRETCSNLSLHGVLPLWSVVLHCHPENGLQTHGLYATTKCTVFSLTLLHTSRACDFLIVTTSYWSTPICSHRKPS